MSKGIDFNFPFYWRGSWMACFKFLTWTRWGLPSGNAPWPSFSKRLYSVLNGKVILATCSLERRQFWKLELLIFVHSLFSVIRLLVPMVIISVYCGQAERYLKDPTPVRTQMLSPPATTCTSCARHTGPLEPTASLCVWVGQHLAPYGRLLVGAKSSRTFSSVFFVTFILWLHFLPSPLHPSSYKRGFSYRYVGHHWVLKLLTLACEIKVLL